MAPGCSPLYSWAFELHHLSQLSCIGLQNLSLTLNEQLDTSGRIGSNGTLTVLENVDLSVDVGGIYAVVGHATEGGSFGGFQLNSGLLLRLLSAHEISPTSGNVIMPPQLRVILIDEAHTTLLDETVEQNLLFAQNEAKSAAITEEQIQAACEFAGMRSHLIGKRKSTSCGPFGRYVGAEDRASIAIATAILSDFDVILVDSSNMQTRSNAHLIGEGLSRWVKAGVLPGMRKASRTVFFGCDKSRISPEACGAICLGSGDAATGMSFTMNGPTPMQATNASDTTQMRAAKLQPLKKVKNEVEAEEFLENLEELCSS